MLIHEQTNSLLTSEDTLVYKFNKLLDIFNPTIYNSTNNLTKLFYI